MSDAIYYSIIGMLGIGFVLALLKYWNRKLHQKYSLEENNLSYGIYLASQLIGFSILYSMAVEPLLVLKTTLEISSKSASFTDLSQYLGLFLVIVLVFFTVIVSAATLGYKVFTGNRSGLFDAIKVNNKSASLIVASLIISSAMIISSILEKVLMNILPHPSLF